MEPEKNNADLYIDPVFDKNQRYIWTSDLVKEKGRHRVWVIDFYNGGSRSFGYRHGYVRAVRSRQSSIE